MTDENMKIYAKLNRKHIALCRIFIKMRLVKAHPFFLSVIRNQINKAAEQLRDIDASVGVWHGPNGNYRTSFDNLT